MKSVGLAGLLGLASSCSHQPAQPENSHPSHPGESRVEITYELRHSHRRFSAHEKSNQVTGQTFLDHQIVMEGPIDPDHYRSFLLKVSEFLEKAGRAPAETATPCRSHFTITLYQDEATRTFKGCREQGSHETALSRLVREGEFLLYSKK